MHLASRWLMGVSVMASVREVNGKLFWDFRYKGVRCREYTALEDSKGNRQKMEKILKQIEQEITAGTFDYRRQFPQSKLAVKFDGQTIDAVSLSERNDAVARRTPLFRDFSQQWFNELSIGWRRSYKNTVHQILEKRLIPEYGEMEVGNIRREDLLIFRSNLAKDPGRKMNSKISPRRINAIMLVLKQVLNEAADRYNFSTQAQRIKPLKVQKSDIQPSLPL